MPETVSSKEPLKEQCPLLVRVGVAGDDGAGSNVHPTLGDLVRVEVAAEIAGCRLTGLEPWRSRVVSWWLVGLGADRETERGGCHSGVTEPIARRFQPLPGCGTGSTLCIELFTGACPMTSAQPSSPMPATTTATFSFHGVRYLVTDVQRAVTFYTTHLGFTLEYQQLPAFATVALGPLKLHAMALSVISHRRRPVPGRRGRAAGRRRHRVRRLDVVRVAHRIRHRYVS